MSQVIGTYIETEKQIKSRYEGILKRSFKYDLDLFLFEKFLTHTIIEERDFSEDYKDFSPEENLIRDYILACQISDPFQSIITPRHIIGNLDKGLKNWKNKFSSQLPKYKEIFCQNRFIDYSSFKKIYEEQDSNKCFYCKITVSEIMELIKAEKIKTKRLFIRGRSMEIDRRKPQGKYEKENMVFCCYWCNNAKSDEFSDAEFMKIGKIIEQIWANRKKTF